MKKCLAMFVALAFCACGNDFGPQTGNTGGTDGGTNQCTLTGITCVANSHCEGNTCVCNQGFGLDGGTCAALPDGGSSACGLVAACAVNSHCDSSNRCTCNAGFSEINGVCVAGACGQVASCATNSHCDANSNTCVCNAGFAMVNGACAAIACGLVTQCATNSHCENNACVCDSGFNPVNGVCTRTDGGINSQLTCPTDANPVVRLEAVVTSNNGGFSVSTGWCLVAWDEGGNRVPSSTSDCRDSITVNIVGCGQHIWFTQERNGTSNDRTVNSCVTLESVGITMTAVRRDGTRVSVQSQVKATFDSDGNNATRKWPVETDLSKQASRTCQ